MNSLEALKKYKHALIKIDDNVIEFCETQDYKHIEKDLLKLQAIENADVSEGLEILTNITNGNGYDWFEQRILKIDKLKTILKNASALEKKT